MKTKIFNALIAGACVVALASCDDNSWNNEHLNGFDDDPDITDVQSIEYTLTDADYASIASNSTNRALAGEELADALKAVGTQHYFTANIAAKDYVPAFLGSNKFPYFVLDEGSAVKVTYKVATNLPQEIADAASAVQYEVSDDNYKAIWGSEEDYISAFAPSHTAAKNLPAILAEQYPDAQAGQYAIVSYKTSDQEPVFTTKEDEEVAYTHNKVTSITSGKKYVLVAEGVAATVVSGKGYGYLGATTGIEEDGKGINVADASLIEFTFVATEGGYNIIDAEGRYVYQSGTYNSFNFSAEKPAEGAVWTVEAQGDGSMKITNTSVGKFIQYDTKYSSYGSYADARGVTPAVYERYEPYSHVKASAINTGCAYVMVAEGVAATVVSGKGYGYLGATPDIEEDGKGINVADASLLEFTFVATDGGYNIIDAEGRYVYQSGTYNSFNFSAEKPAEGAVWTVEAQGDGSMKITNTSVGKFIQYDTKYSSYGSYADARGVMPVLYEKVGGAVVAASRALAASVPTIKENAVYVYSGSEWKAPANFTILQPADYTAMGQNYGNLSTSATPEELLPLYLKNKFPYAQAEDVKFVLYKYYDGSATNYRCDQYIYDGADWAMNNGIVEESAQFVKNNGKWMFDPNVTITLPNGGSHEICKLYYQTCVDWVFENIDKPLGSTDIKSGKGYVTSYGNNEYYCGTSAYYGNVDIRPDKALTQYPAGYEGMSNEEIVELMKSRFCKEVMPAALAKLHPDAVPVDGLQVVYSINFAAYTGSTEMHTVRYEVTAPGQFTFIDCTWDAAE